MIDMHKFDPHIDWQKCTGRKVLCRNHDCEHKHYDDPIPKDAWYLRIKGWGAGGGTTLALCLEHAPEFIKECKAAEKKLKELQKDKKDGTTKSKRTKRKNKR
jgi:hypothetical protein